MENSQELSQSRLSGIPSIMYTFRVLIKYVGGTAPCPIPQAPHPMT